MAYQQPPMAPYPQQPVYAPMVMGPKPSSGALMGAGVMNIITAIIGFIYAAIFGFLTGFATFFPLGGIFLLLCTVFFVVGGVFAILAAAYCFKRHSYGICIAGSVLGMIFTGLSIFGFITGLIALILVVVGKDDFLDRPAQAYAPMPVAVMPPYPVYQPAPPQQAGGQWKFCSNCGSQVAMSASACPKCGARV